MVVTSKMLNDSIGLIHNMDADQISHLVDAIKLRRARINNNAMHTVQVGDKVKFTGRLGPVSGEVTKKAIKYVTVDTGQGRWKVPANMLEIV